MHHCPIRTATFHIGHITRSQGSDNLQGAQPFKSAISRSGDDFCIFAMATGLNFNLLFLKGGRTCTVLKIEFSETPQVPGVT